MSRDVSLSPTKTFQDSTSTLREDDSRPALMKTDRGSMLMGFSLPVC